MTGPPLLTGRALGSLRRSLLSWYRGGSRALPWRRHRDPYRIWVAEVMLQQTTVKAVVPYYQAFLARFPTLRALAAANEDEVLAAWSGLGYYQRARNLRRGAAHVASHHGGRFPRELSAALAVPGVGRYTAAAVLSIAYEAPWAAVDGNIARVLSRLLARKGGATARALQSAADRLLAAEAPGDWNQALMDLGATVCTPRSPSCETCPVSRYCRAVATGRPEAFSPRIKRARLVDARVVAVVCTRAGRILLARAMDGGPVSRLWELPQTPLEWRGRPSPSAAIATRYGLRVAAVAKLVEVQHAITNRRIRAEAWTGQLLDPVPAGRDGTLWAAPRRLPSLPVSGITRKLLDALWRLPDRPAMS